MGSVLRKPLGGWTSRPRRQLVLVGLVCLAGGVLLGTLASGGTADPASLRLEPASPPKVPTRPATNVEIAGAKLTAPAPAKLAKRAGSPHLKTLISRRAIMTDSGTGNFAGLTCPKGYVAISGGAQTGFTNLLISQSAPIKPDNGRFTPRTWWVAVTNFSVDGNHEKLPWFPLVNCLNKVRH
jgi:hypothetical protein